TGPPRREHTRHAVQRVDGQPGVVRHGGQPRGLRRVPGLGERVLLERRPCLGGLVERLHVRHPDDLEAVYPGLGQNATQLLEFARVPRRQQHPRTHLEPFFFGCGGSGSSPGYGAPSASAWIRASSAHPACARSSILSSVDRVNVAPSPVPCPSIHVPASVATTFMSTSARESSS